MAVITRASALSCSCRSCASPCGWGCPRHSCWQRSYLAVDLRAVGWFRETEAQVRADAECRSMVQPQWSVYLARCSTGALGGKRDCDSELRPPMINANRNPPQRLRRDGLGPLFVDLLKRRLRTPNDVTRMDASHVYAVCGALQDADDSCDVVGRDHAIRIDVSPSASKSGSLSI